MALVKTRLEGGHPSRYNVSVKVRRFCSVEAPSSASRVRGIGSRLVLRIDVVSWLKPVDEMRITNDPDQPRLPSSSDHQLCR